ncbi:hypothetical protein JAAARDRAFT_204366 [Jaapia argillacea MUCL 33604]|uniref:Uncharacterized protein n=1 Tax=Jaapia argillacea MUCL 33604 TaxID=933084 RepID=A0A067Q4L2_9AGAM|nr:hypothetical protein JAAARDRAFT_204366 [Jaapia argillacea MUCL 33604]
MDDISSPLASATNKDIEPDDLRPAMDDIASPSEPAENKDVGPDVARSTMDDISSPSPVDVKDNEPDDARPSKGTISSPSTPARGHVSSDVPLQPCAEIVELGTDVEAVPKKDQSRASRRISSITNLSLSPFYRDLPVELDIEVDVNLLLSPLMMTGDLAFQDSGRVAQPRRWSWTLLTISVFVVGVMGGLIFDRITYSNRARCTP